MIETISKGEHAFVMCNFAPPDMVGHTGVYEAAVKACAATGKAIRKGPRKAICIDIAIGRIEEACKKHGYVMYVTADHGNAEKMYDDVGGKHTAHTCCKGMCEE